MTKDTPEMTLLTNIVLWRYLSLAAGAGFGFSLLVIGVSFEHAVLIGLIIAKFVEAQSFVSVCLDYLKEKRQQLSPISAESELK